jgi:hypothetical protein
MPRVSYDAASAALGLHEVWVGAPESLPAGMGVPLLSGPLTAIETDQGTSQQERNAEVSRHTHGSRSSRFGRLRADKNPLVAPHLAQGKYVVGGVDIGTDINLLEDAASGELW